MKEASFPVSGVGHELVLLSHRAEEIINEAEAKREEDCCEWKLVGLETHTLHWETACGSYPRGRDKKFNYCPYCGKHIKISEME